MRERWAGYAAAVWSAVFAVFHIIWALGYYALLDPVMAAKMFAVPWKLAYDIVIAGICVFAVPLCLALVMPWGRRVPRRALGFFAWTGTGLLVLRSVASIMQAGYLMTTGEFAIGRMGVWEWWFYLGAILYVIAMRRWSRETAPVSSA